MEYPKKIRKNWVVHKHGCHENKTLIPVNLKGVFSYKSFRKKYLWRLVCFHLSKDYRWLYHVFIYRSFILSNFIIFWLIFFPKFINFIFIVTKNILKLNIALVVSRIQAGGNGVRTEYSSWMDAIDIEFSQNYCSQLTAH